MSSPSCFDDPLNAYGFRSDRLTIRSQISGGALCITQSAEDVETSTMSKISYPEHRGEMRSQSLIDIEMGSKSYPAVTVAGRFGDPVRLYHPNLTYRS